MGAGDGKGTGEDPKIGDILTSIRNIIEDDQDDKGAEPVVAADPMETRMAPPTAPSQSGSGLDESIMPEVTAELGINQLTKLNSMIRMGDSGVTLTDVVRSLLRPMLREWMHDNLPQMVEQKVEFEIKRLTNRAENG